MKDGLENKTKAVSFSKNRNGMGKKLTIGMVTYNDFDGVFFSIQSIRMFHKEILKDVEFLIIDNNPDDRHGKAVREFCNSVSEPIRYIPFTEYNSTAIRTKLFELADTPYVLCQDCHVMFECASLKKLINFLDSGKDGGNLLQGPLLYNDMKNVGTHFDLVWRNRMWGTWGTDGRGKNPDAEPFEIPAQGMGCFSCRKSAWLGFNPRFRGFGGEEGYIHEKFRKHGKKTLCLPFLRWMHRFGRPNGVPYPLQLENRVKNYFIGFDEVGLDTSGIYDHFIKDCKMNKTLIAKWHDEVKKETIEILQNRQDLEYKKKNILYIGSGNSAKLVEKVNIENYTVVCLNNAWRLFDGQCFDYWIRPNDFPRENYPKNTNYKQVVEYKDYSVCMENVCQVLNINTTSPQHYLGYTSFFAGLYWIMNALKPEKISLLGFDHDYNMEKVKKWENENRPTPQNNFNNKSEKTIDEWANNYFKNMKQDFFYGHGTPDPLRLGEKQLISKFELAKKNSTRLKIKLVNLSPVVSPINTIEKEQIV